MDAAFLQQLLDGLANTVPAEWIADVTGVLYALLVMWRRRLGWVFGGVSSLILAVLTWQARLPMQALLQVSYVLAAVYGWWSWSRPGNARPISVWHWRGHLAAIAGCVLVSLLLSKLLTQDSAFPFLDSLVFCTGMLATWLLARVHLENWAYWILIDATSIYLCIKQGLVAVAQLFVVYLCIAVVGLAGWWKTWRQSPA
jgi:nicotinamide mononucleotide transporter